MICDMTDQIAAVQARMTGLGLSWDSPEVKTWMERAGFSSRYAMPVNAYEVLERRLAERWEMTPSEAIAANIVEHNFGILDRRLALGEITTEQATREVLELKKLSPVRVEALLKQRILKGVA